MRVHLRFTEKDRDLCRWRHSIKRNMLTYYICQILRAEIAGKIAFIPEPDSFSPDTSSCDVFMKINDPEIENFVISIPEYKRNSKIKFIIRKHLHSQMKATDNVYQFESKVDADLPRGKPTESSQTKKEIIEEAPKEKVQKQIVESEEDRAAILALIAMGGE